MHGGNTTASTADTAGWLKTQLGFTVLATVQATLIFTIALIMIPLPLIAEEFALTEAQILLLQVAYGLPFSGLLLFGGRLADCYDARNMLAIGLAGFGLASFIASVAPDFGVLIAMRFLQGIGGAVIAPAALAVLRSLIPDRAAFGRAMAIWGGVSVLGAAVGFISSGMIASAASWRWMFVVPIAVSVLGLAAPAGLLPPRRKPDRAERPALDLVAALLATSGVVLASYGLIASHDSNWLSLNVLGPFAAGIVLLVAFMILERQAKDPLLPPGFLLDASRMVGLIGMLLAASGSLLIEYVLLIYLQAVRGWTSFETAASFVPFAAALIGANFVTPLIVSRFGATNSIVAGFLVGAVGLALLAAISRETAYLAIFLPGQVVLAVGIALVFAGAAVLSTANVQPQQMGLAGGVMNTAMELGPTVGFTVLMAVATTRADPVEGYAWAFGAAGTAYGVAALLAWVVTPVTAVTSSESVPTQE